jgi:UDP-N-acetylglucosamine 2-epimerase (non-hydrolysing)
VHGDTTTAITSCIAGYYSKIALIGHVEAGLRTGDIYSPYPEELNRKLISRIATLHFAPTENSYQNLIEEGISHQDISITGNTVIDAMQYILNSINKNIKIKESLDLYFEEIISKNIKSNRFILITGHRRENFGSKFVEICNAIKFLASKYPELLFIYPVHLNPNVQSPVNDILGSIENVHLIAPLHYEAFIYLLSQCFLVLTDSGGIQEEAPSLGKPVLVMRDVTERPEGIDAGTVILVGANRDAIASGVSNLLDNPSAYEVMSQKINPYGDGNACKRIIEKIREYI